MHYLRNFRLPVPHVGVSHHDDGKNTQHRCHGAPAEDQPGAPTPSRRHACGLGRRFLRRQREGRHLAAFGALGKMVQHPRSFLLREGLLREGREQVGVRVVSALESSFPLRAAGRPRRIRVGLQPCNRDFWKSGHNLVKVSVLPTIPHGSGVGTCSHLLPTTYPLLPPIMERLPTLFLALIGGERPRRVR